MKDVFLNAGKKISRATGLPEWLQVPNFRTLEWFRPPEYTLEVYSKEESSYGPHLAFYQVNRKLRLLNLGSKEAIADIVSHTSLEEGFGLWQYDHGNNLMVHDEIMSSCYFKGYDGTYISEKDIDHDLLDDLSGPEEIVLFTTRTKNAISLLSIHLMESTWKSFYKYNPK